MVSFGGAKACWFRKGESVARLFVDTSPWEKTAGQTVHTTYLVPVLAFQTFQGVHYTVQQGHMRRPAVLHYTA